MTMTCAQCFKTSETDVHAYILPGWAAPVMLCDKHKPSNPMPADDYARQMLDVHKVIGRFRTGHLCLECRDIGTISFFETIDAIASHIIEAHGDAGA